MTINDVDSSSFSVVITITIISVTIAYIIVVNVITTIVVTITIISTVSTAFITIVESIINLVLIIDCYYCHLAVNFIAIDLVTTVNLTFIMLLVF